MSVRTALGVGALLLGAATGLVGLVLIGLLWLTSDGLARLWSRHGLRNVRYRRAFANDRAIWGDRVGLEVSVENGKVLPLAWLRTDDFVTEGTVVAEQPIIATDRPGLGVLRNIWTLGPYEKVVRHFTMEAEHRGIHRFESVDLTVADLFGRGVASHEEKRPASLLVRPRTLPVRSASPHLFPLGSRAAHRGLLEDPALFAGVRPFQRGDPMRRIHQRASARLGRPVSKRFDPSIARQSLLALDLQTHNGPYWLLSYDENVVESLIVATASLARRLLADGAACGIAVNGWTYSRAQIGFVAPQAGRDQLARIADLLGRVSSVPSVPYSRLMAAVPQRLPSGALIVTISSRDTAPLVPALRRLRSSGFEVRHVAVGPLASSAVARARRFGIDSSVAHLEPDWRSSDAVTLAS